MFFFFYDTATTDIYTYEHTRARHDAVPISVVSGQHKSWLKPANLASLRRTKGLSRYWVVDSDAVADYTADIIGVDRARIHVWPIFMVAPDKPEIGRAHV